MLIPLLIDTSDLADEFSLSKEDVHTLIDNAVKATALEYYRLWQNQASKNLKSTRNRYLDNLVYVDEGLMKGAVILRDEDPLAMMLEEGASEFDLKEGFANSPKRKIKKDGGWYMSIPFRYATPQALGESEIFSGILPPEIYEQAKSLEANVPMGGGMRSKGLAIEDIPNEFQEKTVRKAMPTSSLLEARKDYISKSSRYEGLMKVKDSTTKQTSGYMSFRRVSDNSDPSSWIHSGLEQRHFAEAAMTELNIENIVDVEIDNFLNTL